ncbi:hypothetical protein Asch03_03300 [Acinetobacter schindleri]
MIEGQRFRCMFMFMFTINADNYTFMHQLHKSRDKKRLIIFISEKNQEDWLT